MSNQILKGKTMKNLQQMLPILKSWETGYISPSAQIAIKDAIELLLAQDDKISELTNMLSDIQSKLDSAKKEIDILKTEQSNPRRKAKKKDSGDSCE